MESVLEETTSERFEPFMARAIAKRLYGMLEDGDIRQGFNEYSLVKVHPMSPATLIEVRKSLIKAGTHVVEAIRNYKKYGFEGRYAHTERHLESLPVQTKVHDGHHVATAWEIRGTTVPSFLSQPPNQSRSEWGRINDNEEHCTWAWVGYFAENKLNPKKSAAYPKRSADDFVAVIEKIPEIEELYGAKP